MMPGFFLPSVEVAKLCMERGWSKKAARYYATGTKAANRFENIIIFYHFI